MISQTSRGKSTVKCHYIVMALCGERASGCVVCGVMFGLCGEEFVRWCVPVFVSGWELDFKLETFCSKEQILHGGAIDLGLPLSKL